ncbi:hypothetical protein HA402_006705 [Bradysia odoriphaga]|nr:hypothetical protein HA402_006705 [Bradysia odoriphaga]
MNENQCYSNIYHDESVQISCTKNLLRTLMRCRRIHYALTISKQLKNGHGTALLLVIVDPTCLRKDLKNCVILHSSINNTLPNLFNRNYNPNEFYFGHTEKNRTRDSFRSFVDALFGEDASSTNNYRTTRRWSRVTAQTELNEVFLSSTVQTYSYCKEWNDLKESVDLPDSEPKKFERSELFVNMVKDINQRFGFNGTLQVDDIINMYDICRNEQAWNINVGSAWCSLFTTSQFLLLEYLEDVRMLYKSSQSFNINKNIACHAVKDLLNRLESSYAPIVTAYFTHSTRVQQVLATLGAFDGEKLPQSDNFE